MFFNKNSIQMVRRAKEGKHQDRQEESVESGNHGSADYLGVAHDFGNAKGRKRNARYNVGPEAFLVEWE